MSVVRGHFQHNGVVIISIFFFQIILVKPLDCIKTTYMFKNVNREEYMAVWLGQVTIIDLKLSPFA